ncbi:MAG: cation diffusion facilitator family transporter [Burkholderiales bacterium]|nr:cation diffusion facilitator family transporter [Burkholderiales bacterium]
MTGAGRFALLSIAAAVVTIALKTLAWWLTDSVGLLSDALEGTVNLAGATVMLAMLVVASRPPDEEHAYGYSKAEYFASGFEGMMILLAASLIAYAAIDRLFFPRQLDNIGAGLIVSVIAAAINYAVARKLFEAGRRYNSIALEADAHHLITDVWTSAGVVVGVIAVVLTGWLWLDPLIALAVAANIVWTGIKLVRRSLLGLMDRALPAHDLLALNQVLDRYRAQGIDFHALRTRQAGVRSFVSVHVLMPGEWSVARGHDLAHEIDDEICKVLPGATVATHIEPLDHPESYRDIDLDR